MFDYKLRTMGLGAHTNCLIVVLMMALAVVGNSQSCSQTDTLRGCTNCSTGWLVVNVTSSKAVCSTIVNCTSVDNAGLCVLCSNNSALDIATGNCVYSSGSFSGCQTVNSSVCTACYSNYYLTSTNSCVLAVIDYCWKTNLGSCSTCADENLLTARNCSINPLLCDSFNYQKWVCEKCPTALTIHPSGVFCYNATNLANCLVISQLSCLQCRAGYYLNSGVCQSGLTINLYAEVLPNTYYLNTSNLTYSAICLNQSQTFDTTNKACSTIVTGCHPQYYFSSASLCKPCSVYSNCLSCDAYNCLLCSVGYYLVVQLNSNSITSFFATPSSLSSSKCLPCTIYGCLTCRSELGRDGINQVRCDECLFGYKLSNYTCFQCASGLYYSTVLKACTLCSVANCQYCNADELKCQQCVGLNYYNVATNSCDPISFVVGNNSLSSGNSFEILNKSMPFSSNAIVNDQKLLITSCNGQSNGYTCLCSATTTVAYTSLCYPLYANLTSLTVTSTAFGFSANALTKADYAPNILKLKLLSQLPSYPFSFAPAPSELLSSSDFATHLQITANLIRNNQTKAGTLLSDLSSYVFAQMSSTFFPSQPTIYSGVGYYFKYTPAIVDTDDTSFISTVQTTTRVAEMVFVTFNSSTSSAKRITGTFYVYLNQSTVGLVDVKVKKIDFLGNNEQYTAMLADSVISNAVTSDSDGYVTISKASTCSSSSTAYYYVSSYSTTVLSDPYSSQRIENLIYRDSFIYILVFLTLYLFLLPTCALVDFVDSKSSKRKVPKEEEGSYQGVNHRPESEQEEEVVLKINYKDFFPIYNIANTERPKRLAKLCLFLVNSQHSVTFLSLIYFNLSGGQPLVAVLLAIPAYLCTLVMGYLCGIISLKLQGHWKYTINIVSLGYWILWVAIMGRFVSLQYKPYVFTFVFIFIFLDLLIDFLETLLMYFTIKQDERQIRLFQALSKWLSYRGYYEFDKMAKEITDIRDTA